MSEAKRIQTNIYLDPEALAILQKRCPVNKRYGFFISRLLFEDDLRRKFQEERERPALEQYDPALVR